MTENGVQTSRSSIFPGYTPSKSACRARCRSQSSPVPLYFTRHACLQQCLPPNYQMPDRMNSCHWMGRLNHGHCPREHIEEAESISASSLMGRESGDRGLLPPERYTLPPHDTRILRHDSLLNWLVES